MIASNHPNSFLDSVIIDTLFKQPVWSLARGDVFKNKKAARVLHSMKILPLYRTSEGAENLGANYRTFDACIRLFRQNAVIMIFSEGKCINEWHLRPLRKGTARLAIRAWQEGIPLRVLPIGINYSSFRRFGKNVFINVGEPITRQDVPLDAPDGARHRDFNQLLKEQLEKLVFEISSTDRNRQHNLLEKKPSTAARLLLFIPAAIGWLVHLPIYMPIKRFTWKRTWNNDHYDSILTGILLIVYPPYVLFLTTVFILLFHSWYALLLLVFLPFSAWSYVRIKPQLDTIRSS